MTRDDLISELIWLGYNEVSKSSVKECNERAQKMFDEYEKANSSSDIHNVSETSYLEKYSKLREKCEDVVYDDPDGETDHCGLIAKWMRDNSI